MKCGLLGRKLGHSYSPAIHRHLGSYDYSLFEKEPEELEHFLRNGDFTGLNVTMPYKKSVIPFLDELTSAAQKLGAVNTIVRKADGRLIGHNSDYFGFLSMVRRSGMSVKGKKCLVLGSGGASATAVAVLQELGGEVYVISRTGEHNYENLHMHADAALIVNTTPVGMYPATGQSPVELSMFPNLEGVLDVVYNPARTQILLDAEKRNLPTCNGLWMLVAQAKESAEYFTGHPINDALIHTIYCQLRQQMENIILIGMPGCGKSTVSSLLAEQTGRTLVDIDAEIEKRTGRTPGDIIRQDGEPAFRQLESKVISDFGKQSGLIIATGGGCVTKDENYEPLHQNGQIFWLQRQLSALATQGRPLSIDLSAMYERRAPMYEAFADFTVVNNGSPEDTAAQILAHWEKLS